jgi:hypothetical protein
MKGIKEGLSHVYSYRRKKRKGGENASIKMMRSKPFCTQIGVVRPEWQLILEEEEREAAASTAKSSPSSFLVPFPTFKDSNYFLIPYVKIHSSNFP